jgi:hypothetical protein
MSGLMSLRAADATSHLFFAYLRSLAPDETAVGGISALPRSLQSLLSQTEYPPQTPTLLFSTTTKVVMIVDSVSPTPFALLRRAKNFEYRDDDVALQAFSAYDDTVATLTDECRRVLECISKVNRTELSTNSNTQDQSWSRFEDMGFSGILDNSADSSNGSSGLREFSGSGLRAGPRSRTTDGGRPTTPSWADFLSSGFADENNQGGPTTLLAPSAKLPPIGETHRVHSSQSHVRNGLQTEEDLDPGELASITRFDLDDTFWWVWMTSLAGEETVERKAAFGRCTLIETKIPGAKWLVMEEQVKGAAAGPEEGAYIAEKKSMFSWTKRGRLGRRKSTGKKPAKEPYNRTTSNTPMSKTSIGPDQHARVQAVAARLAQGQKDQQEAEQFAQRRGRMDDAVSTKTNSVLTLQPHLLSEAGPAMKWDKKFGEGAKDRDALRAQYLGDMNAGRGGGSHSNLLSAANGSTSALSRMSYDNRDLPALPKSEVDLLQSPTYNGAPSPGPASPAPHVTSHQYDEGPSMGPVPPAKNTPLPPTVLDEKPTPHVEDHEQHPALRQTVPDRKAVAPAKPDQRPSVEDTHVPESKKPSPKKLTKKKEGGGGFRKLFGKKKADTAAPAKSEEDPRAWADAGRSVSRLEEHNTAPVREPSLESLERPQPPRAMSPAISAISATQREPALQVGPSSSAYEQHEAQQEFNRFDQGPMDDVPAFVPEESSEDEAAPSVPRRAPPPAPETPPQPMQYTQYDPATVDDISEESVDLSQQNAVAQDRWAQIRKNAAERAARLSEEQSRRSQSQSARTDEGETSGEETIESRVARIKARVAELTGNMDGQSPQQPASGARR